MHSLIPLAHGPRNEKSWAVVIHIHGKSLLPCSFNTFHDLGATPVVQGEAMWRTYATFIIHGKEFWRACVTFIVHGGQFWRACFTPIAHGVGSYIAACMAQFQPFLATNVKMS